MAEETPRSTRQSARLRGTQSNLSDNPDASSFDKAVEGKPLEPSPTKAASSSRSQAVDQEMLDDAVPYEATPDVPKESNDEESGVLEDSNPDSKPVEETNDDDGNKTDALPTTVQSELPPPSPKSQKRKSPEADGDPASATPSNKQLKLEEADLDRALEQQLQNGTAEKHDSQSAADATEESKVDDESRQITDAEDSTAPNGVEPLSKSPVKGRNGLAARFASRGGKGKGRPRGKGVAGRRGAGRGRQVESPEISVRPERSPSPFAAARKLLDRKSELDRAFKKVAAAQRLALHVMAVRTERQLARDKHAHQKVPEFEKLEVVLSTYRQRKQETLRHEYEYQTKQENLLFNSEKERIEAKFRTSARHIQEEHLLAAQGDYMSFVEGRRAAEDDEHTEPDDSETEAHKRLVAKPAKKFVRGFNSPYVRDPAGAAAYERAEFGWEHFVQRARLGEDIDPQIKEMGETGAAPANKPTLGTLEMLLEATGVVANQQPPAMRSAEFPPPLGHDMPAVALSALADVASSKTPIRTPRPSIVHTILSQPVADPRSYMLPRPTPHAHPPPPPPPRQQPRPLLPAGQQIPSINEQLGLPDPFVPGGGPPQLPPPPGSNFHRPPPPGFLQGNPLYFPPPRQPSGPRPPY